MLYINRVSKHFATISYATVCYKKKCSPSLRNDPRNYLSESNPPLLMNKEDQMASSISQKVRVMQHASIMRNHFMFWDGIRSERICLSATINKLNYSNLRVLVIA